MTLPEKQLPCHSKLPSEHLHKRVERTAPCKRLVLVAKPDQTRLNTRTALTSLKKKLNYQTIITPNSNKTKQTLQCNASNVHQLVHVHAWSSKILILIDSRSRRTHHLRRRAIGHPRSRGENMTQSTKYMGSSSSRIQSENPATHSWTMIGS